MRYTSQEVGQLRLISIQNKYEKKLLRSWTFKEIMILTSRVISCSPWKLYFFKI